MNHGVRETGVLGVLMRGFRQAAGLTQHELASRAGLSLGSIRDMEQGRTHRPSRGSMAALATALGLTPAQVDEMERAAAGCGLRLQVLGPLAVWRNGAMVRQIGTAQRTVLGLLALSPGSVVHRSEIIDALWADRPPANAVNLVQVHVSRLRKVLAHRHPDGGGVLGTANGGYRLRAGPAELDLLEFSQLTADARLARANGDHEAACSLYQAALGLWRGAPVADLDLLRGHPAITGLAMQRAEVVVEYARTASAVGRHDRVLSLLRDLAGRDPLNEPAHAQLMIALAGCGQQAEALSVYRALRDRLDDELGMPPGEHVVEAHQLVLRQEVPAPRSASEQDVPDHKDVPRQLPGAVRPFAGRARELLMLTGLLDRARDDGPGTLVISAIGGTAGVGKTALAVRWAHQVADRFPDGQLYVDLRGYDPAQPMPAGDALGGFLRALGVPGEDIPLIDNERAANYRSLLSGRRMLILLDNAREAEQVRPLLPGTPGCVTVVTSRDSLAGLVARDGATRLDLDALPLADAVGLLRNLIGDRVDEDPRAAEALVQACCRLPLALRVAAEFTVKRHRAPLAELVAELSDQRRRLDLLDADGDPRTMMRAVFSWSYRHLPEDAARAFRLTGLHPGPYWDRYAIGALACVTAEEADAILRTLASAYLIRPVRAGRYAAHDLLRAYARDLAFDRDGEAECATALTRLFDFYLHTVAGAMDILYPGEHDRPRAPLTGAQASRVPFADGAEALAWLDAECDALAVVTAYMTGSGWPGHAVRLSGSVWQYLDSAGRLPEAVAIHSHALRAARDTGDRRAEATALMRLGVIDFRKGRYEQATDRLQQALPLFRKCGDQNSEARTMCNLGLIDLEQGHYDQAVGQLQEALVLFCECGDQNSEARTMCNLGLIDLEQGRHDQAADRLEQSVTLLRKIGNRRVEAYALVILGKLDLRQGRYQQAGDRMREGLAVWRETGYRSGEADVLRLLGALDGRQGRYSQADDHLQEALAVCTEIGQASVTGGVLAELALIDLAQGRYEQAAGRLQQALDLFREIGDLSGECTALNGLGEVRLGAGCPDQARVQYGEALRLASRLGLRYEQARAYDGLGGAYDALGDDSRARSSWQAALSLYTGLSVPEAERVRARLA